MLNSRRPFTTPLIRENQSGDLVLWLPGQGSRGIGTSVMDRSGRGNDMTISGAAWTSDNYGHNVLKFDGTDDYCTQKVYDTKQGTVTASMVAGTAFINDSGQDFAPYAGVAGVSKPYMLVATDSAGLKAWGYCFTPDTLVWTDNGRKKIKDIIVGEKVLTHKGRYMNVLQVMERPIDEDIIEINAYVNQKLQATKEHPFFVSKDGVTYDWVNADKIEKDDWLVFIPPISEEIKEIKIGDKNIVIDNNFLEFIGAYISEGCSTSRNRIIISNKDFGLISRLFDYLVNIGFNPHIYGNNGDCFNLSITNSELKEYLSEEFGNGSYDMRLPKWIFGLDKDKLKVLLKTLINCDGCIQNYNIAYYSVNSKLINDMQLLFAKLGVASNIYEKNGNKLSKNIQYRVSFSPNKELRELFSLPEIERVSQSEKFMKVVDGALFLKVTEINKIKYSGLVYNLSVDTDNSYVAGIATVHNCGEQGTGETLGGDLLANGNFSAWTGDDPDSWNVTNEDVNNYVAESSGKARIVSNNTAAIHIKQSVLAIGKLYKVTYSIKASAAGQIRIGTNGTITDGVTDGTAGDNKTFYITAQSVTLYIVRNGACDVTLDDISAQQVLTPTTNGVKIYSTKTGSTKSWANVETNFNANAISSYEIRKTDFQITGALTVGAWVKPASIGAARGIIGKDDTNNRSYDLSMNSSGYPTFYVGNTLTTRVARTSSLQLTVGNYYFVTAVYSSSANEDVYVNGVLQNGSIDGSIPSSVADSKTAFQIGKTYGDYFNGSIDEPFIYNRALSAAEISQIYNQTKHLFGK